MVLEKVLLDAPGPGTVIVENRAIGLNYIDTYHRSGLYPRPLPVGIGLEGAAVVQALGEVVTLCVGDRVAYCSACLLKGQTRGYLLQRAYRLSSGETCLFHAAAGGVGRLFVQWANSIGATVIGTVGSAQKVRAA
jgi:NADPH2:quinone reductase